MTPREFAAVVEGVRRRELRRFSDSVAAAWFGAKFARAAKMPELDRVLKAIANADEPPEPMTPEQLLATIRKWNRELGGEDLLPPDFGKKED